MKKVLYRFYWTNRPVWIDDVVAQSKEILTRLRDEIGISSWYKLAWSKEKALSKPLALTDEAIKSYVSKKDKQNLTDGYSDLGYDIRVYSIGQNGGDIGLSLRIGSSLEFIPNIVVLSVETEEDPDMYEAMQIAKTIIQLTSPDWGSVQTAELDNLIEDKAGKIGWITYTKKKRLKLDPVKFNTEAFSEGSLITLTHQALHEHSKSSIRHLENEITKRRRLWVF